MKTLFPIILILAVGACKRTQQFSNAPQNGVASRQGQGAHADGESKERGQITSPVNPSMPAMPAPLPEPEGLIEEAQEPVVVSGSYLTCTRTTELEKLDCLVSGPDMNTLTFPDDGSTSFRHQIVGGKSTDLIYTQENTALGSIFHVTSQETMTGLIVVSLLQKTGKVELDFDLGKLDPIIGERKPEAVELLNVSFAGKNRFGDNRAEAGDDCYKVDPKQAATPSGILHFNVTSSMNKIDIRMFGICGLQASTTYVILTSPKGGNSKVALQPGMKDQSLFIKDLTPGQYTLTIDNGAASMPGKTQDDFLIEGVRFFGEGGQKAAFNNVSVTQ